MSNLRLWNSPQKRVGWVSFATLTAIWVLSSAQQVQAHHPMGGQLPSSWLEGFLSGLAHPMIGPDHFAFVIAVGLLAATKPKGIFLPIAFLGTALIGSSLHLLGMSLPGLEWVVSGSVLMFGILLALKTRPSLGILVGLGAIAGIFHGYAYGEAIFGAERTPLLAYLAGFTIIQCAVSLLAMGIGTFALNPFSQQSGLSLRFAGFVISGAGAAFLSTMLLNTILPVPSIQ